MPPIDSLPGLPEDYTPKVGILFSFEPNHRRLDYSSYKFFMQDVVSKIMNPLYRGTIVRCWSNDEAPPPPMYLQDPLDRPLKRGEVGIMENSPAHPSKREIVSEASLVLIHRDFFPGDIVKRSLTASSSAVVINIQSEVQLCDAFDNTKITKDWVSYDKLKNISLEPGDKVVYDQWIGTVQDVFEAGQFEPEGRTNPYFLTAPAGFFGVGATLQRLVDRYHGPAPPLPPFASQDDTCVRYFPLILAISWNAINQQLAVSEQSKYPEPPAIWQQEELENLTWWPSPSRQYPGFRQPVFYKEPTEAPQLDTKGSPKTWLDAEGPIFKVCAIRNKVQVRWQDGSETLDFSSALVPYPNIDDYETWPGDYLIWHGDEDERRAAVVQSFDARQRVANLLFPDSGERSTVSVLELETSGPEHTEYGVRVGEIVLLTLDNDEAPPNIPSLGRFEVDPSVLDRLDECAHKLMDYSDPATGIRLNIPLPPAGNPSSIDWWGEVTYLHLDGTISVRLASGATITVPLKQLVRLQDGEAQMEEHVQDMDMMAAEEIYEDMIEAQGLGPHDEIPVEMRERVMEQMMLKMMGHQLSSRGMGEAFELWKAQKPELSDPTAAAMAGPLPARLRNGAATTGDGDVEAEDWETVDGSDEEMDEDAAEVGGVEDASMKDVEEIDHKMDEDEEVGISAGASAVPEGHAGVDAGPSSPKASAKTGGGLSDLVDDDAWQRFTILESAPPDHHFIDEKVGGANKAYQNRLQKERKTLMNALPGAYVVWPGLKTENILVRTYEDRTDLMRVLIIGPESTPYANAPFIFDVYLKPTAFPQEPPLVHFHSHTNGLGRCNRMSTVRALLISANLYEEGKVCLSVLGTWAGEQSETWNPAKSSLLQVFVSISGLVLVRSPYFCEPGVAKLEGTREGRLNSRLYSEKAYILSRNFVRQALLHPPTGFEEEIKHFYIARGRLRSVLDHAKNLISASEASAAKEDDQEEEKRWNEDAVAELTLGAILTLKKTVATLAKIAEKEGVA